ncbi:MAG: lysophospholipid acyltransferase family protein [Candidatus Promineifilaceae bacterium]
MMPKIIRTVARIILRLIAKVELINFDRIPQTGSAIVVSNHIGRLDAIIALIITGRDDVIMMIAEKYQKHAIWRWAARQFDALWLDRYHTDFKTLREVIKRLKAGGLLGMSPEGTRSPTGTLQPAKQGAAYLAIKTGVPVYPVAITGTWDKEVISRLKRLKRLHITITVGKPFTLSAPDRQHRDAALQAGTDEMMCRIAALLPPEYRGVYANHPRLKDLLKIDD